MLAARKMVFVDPGNTSAKACNRKNESDEQRRAACKDQPDKHLKEVAERATADVLTSLSAVNTSNHSSNDPGQRGAVALTDHELTEFAYLSARGL